MGLKMETYQQRINEFGLVEVTLIKTPIENLAWNIKVEKVSCQPDARRQLKTAM